MTIIGITGISGSGKTAAARILADIGGFVVDADPLAHELMKKGRHAYDEIIDFFGTSILGTDGEIHRPALGKVVFEDNEKLSRLEAIIHPKVITKTMELIEDARNEGYSFAVIDAPLLIEAGMDKYCDSTWLITANHETKIKRIMKRDNITRDVAAKRLASRQGDEALKPHVHIVIENNNDFADLAVRVKSALETTLQMSRYF
ncbi:MAG: dephospho-CoA kinase [Defluviitaleaceae bacterium]|nr:dephospho-CoA kinase [Defluviitaleaceae bacterium]